MRKARPIQAGPSQDKSPDTDTQLGEYMTDQNHPVVVAANGVSGLAPCGTPLRLIAYYPLGEVVPELHWVPATTLEVCRG